MVKKQDLEANIEIKEELKSVSTDDSDIPPMPDWRNSPRKPFLEKSTRSNWDIRREKIQLFFEQSPVRPRLIIFALLLILLTALGLHLYNQAQESDIPQIERDWLKLEMPKFKRDSFHILSGTESPEERLLSIFFDEDQKLVYDQAYLENEKRGERSSQLVLRTNKQERFTFKEQMALLDLYLARRAEADFLSVRKNIQAYFTDVFDAEQTELYWPERLAYLRRLFIFLQYWDNESIIQEVNSESDRLLAVFTAGLKGNTEDFSQRVDEYFYSTEKEDYDDLYSTETVHLADVDLWVLNCLSSVNEEWLEIFQEWLQIVKSAELESGFYAYAWNAEEKSYLPSAGESFRSETYSSLKQIQHLAEVNEADPSLLNIFDTLAQANSGFYRSYNSVSLAPWEQEDDLAAVLLYRYLGEVLDSNLSVKLSEQALLNYRSKLMDSPAQGLLFLNRSSQDIFPFTENLYAYLIDMSSATNSSED